MTTLLAHAGQWTADEFAKLGGQIFAVGGSVIALSFGRMRFQARRARVAQRSKQSDS